MANAIEATGNAEGSKSERDKNQKNPKLKLDSSTQSKIGRVIDYLFGRNALIGLASFMLLAISGYATWSGMNDFIVGVSTSPAAQGREIVGGLSVSNSFLVIAIVVALTATTMAITKKLLDCLLYTSPSPRDA